MANRRIVAFILVLGFGCAEDTGSAQSAPGPASPSPASAAGRGNAPTTGPSAAVSVPDFPMEVDGMLGVPGGRFVMGEDRRGEGDEHPAHCVTVSPFLLDRTEVTNEDYGRCVVAGRCSPPASRPAEAVHLGPDSRFRGPRQPVSSIPQVDAEAYCAFVDKRLPTEAEWERAARGHDGRIYPWGDEPATPERAVYGGSVTSDVGSKPAGAGPYGHLDLAGNVWEWLADRYDPYAYRRPGAAQGRPGTCGEILAAQDELRARGEQGFTGTNPIPDTCEHSLRGGAFNYGGPGLRSSNRVHHPGAFRLVMSGLRCARDWPAGPQVAPVGRAAAVCGASPAGAAPR